MVRGDSLNLAGIDDGMWVVAADAADFVDLYGETESGDLVVVKRSRFQGSERELTVKEIRFYRDRYELLPRSSNPVHQPIVVQHNHGVDPDKEEVRVIGVVLTSYRDHRRRK
jgi:SOS-response transcriptional repressor LexA